MTKRDLINNLSKISRSWAKEFMEAVAAGDDITMIDQIDLGFYSAYLVANKVVVSTKHNGDEQYVWEPRSGSSYTISPDESGRKLGRGTKITRYLKPDQQLKYLDLCHVKDLVKKRAERFNHEVYFVIENSPGIEATSGTWDIEDLQCNPSELSQGRNIHRFCLIKKKPIWFRKPEEISQQEYTALYKSLTNSQEEFLVVKHFTVEGQYDKGSFQVKALIFVPDKLHNNCKLHLCPILCHQLMAEYLSFIIGVIDSEDLPLKLLLEMPQQNNILDDVREKLVKKSIQLFCDMADNKENYDKFYEAFSKNLKLGIQLDSSNRNKIAELLRYHSTKSGDELTSLKDYVTRMKEGQSDIYYITAESKKAVENSPGLEKLKKEDYEILFMYDAFDECAFGQLKEFEGKKLVSATGQILEDLKPYEITKLHQKRKNDGTDCEVQKKRRLDDMLS